MASRLTDNEVRNFKAMEKPYKKRDGGALELLVTPSGSKLWRYRYRLAGTENVFAIGKYPAVGLQRAREMRDAARRLVKEGVHPSRHRRAERLTVQTEAANTFEAVAREWIDQRGAAWSASYLRQVRSVLAADVYPKIGGLPIKSVTAPQLLSIVKAIEARGATSIALLTRQWASQIFRHAVSTLRADSDVAAAIRGATRRPRTRHKKALSAPEIADFRKKLEGTTCEPSVAIALQLLLLTFVRPGELRCAEWKEFDFERAEWRVPSERMKMREEHVVPLSRQAVKMLQELREFSTGDRLLFPNRRDPKRPMSPTTLNRVLERMGYGGQFSAHGFRTTASTLLNEQEYRADVIERQLAHRPRGVRASYNHATYLSDRRKMMQEWADFIDKTAGKRPRRVAVRIG
jgi:integrase